MEITIEKGKSGFPHELEKAHAFLSTVFNVVADHLIDSPLQLNGNERLKADFGIEDVKTTLFLDDEQAKKILDQLNSDFEELIENFETTGHIKFRRTLENKGIEILDTLYIPDTDNDKGVLCIDLAPCSPD